MLKNCVITAIFLIILILFLLRYKEKFYSSEFINFIHIPKNAGTSINNLCNDRFIYNGHETDVNNQNIKNQLIILRNPLERFISAVKYCLENSSINSVKQKQTVESLLKNNINTPNKFITIWKNKNHPHHKILMSEILNIHSAHKLGNKKLKYKWIYTPQKEWFNKPKYILIMDNLDEELKYISNKLNIPYNLRNINTTSKSKSYISPENLKWINNFYKEDWILYNKYKNIEFKKRINLQED